MNAAEMRFWDKVRIGDGCWEWTACRNAGTGYGRFGMGTVVFLAHRISWSLKHGPIPDGLWVLHRCDNRACVRPGHLFLGTAADNNSDMRAKGRSNSARGERHSRAKITEDDVRAIRAGAAAGQGPAELAARFGIAPCTVSNIAARRIWRHINDEQAERRDLRAR